MGQLAQGEALQNQQRALQIRQQADMMRRMQQMGAGGTSPTDLLDAYENAALGSGNLDAAEKVSTIKSHLATADKARRDAQAKDAQLAANLFADVKTPEEYATALATYRANGGLAQLPPTYSPQGVKYITDMAVKYTDRSLLEERAAKKKESEARIPLIEAQTKLAETRRIAAEKAGGGKTTQRLQANTKLASSMITNDFMGISQEEAYIKGRQIAERAADLMGANPALKDSEATKQAYQEMKTRGTFAPFTARAAHTGTLAKPAAIPMAGSKVDISKMVTGRYYIAPPGSKYAGQTGKWTGKGLEIVTPGTDTGPDSSEPPAAGTEDEEE